MRICRKNLALVALAIVALSSLRLIHLEADTPLGIATGSVGLYVDEGYKTLDPRNLVLYGQRKWNPQDQYIGWSRASPVTQWSYYLAFRMFGPHIGSARLVSIFFFLLLLIGYAYGTAESYRPSLFYIGLLLLGISHTLFFFSRVAIFELPIVASIYWPLFVLRRHPNSSPVLASLLIGSVAAFASLMIKNSAALYLVVAGTGVALSWYVNVRVGRRAGLLSAGVLVVAIGFVAAMTQKQWMSRIDLGHPRGLIDTLWNPLVESSALLLAAALVCAAHAVLCQPRRFFANPYRSSLVALVVVGPLLLRQFPYDPLRYYVPLLPAFLLLVVEWLHLRAWEWPVPRRPHWLLAVASGAVLILALFHLGHALSMTALADLILPGDLARSLFPYFAFAMACLLFWFRNTLIRGKTILFSVLLLLSFSALRDVYVVGRFFLSPSFQSRQISAEIARIVPEDASVGGDWSPFFMLGTKIKALYMSRDTNPASRIRRTTPDYLLFSDTENGREAIHAIRRDRSIELLPAVHESSYIGRKVALHPIHYIDPAGR